MPAPQDPPAAAGAPAAHGQAAPDDAGPAGPTPPSAWICRFAPLIPRGPADEAAPARVLDLACGGGRHTRLFLGRGQAVTAVDRDLSGLADLAAHPGLERLEVDLEDGRPFPLAGRRFAGVVVTNYLHRPLLAPLVAAVAPGGLLLYETFAAGNAAFGRPRNPDFLLQPGELLEAVHGRLRVLAYEDLEVAAPRPACVQRIAARREP